METIKARLKEFAIYNNMSIRSFEEFCGLNRGNVSNMSEDGSIGSDKLSKIFDAFPALNPRWLISGDGNMLSNAPSELSIAQKDKTTDKTPAKTKPRIPFYAAAGALTSALDGVTEHECEFLPVIPTLPYYDFTITVRGDSMYPEFCSGDEVACRLIDDPTFLQWGRAHVLDTSQGVVIKQIYPDNDTILCKSANPKFGDFNIPKEEIYRIAIVVGIVRQF